MYCSYCTSVLVYAEVTQDEHTISGHFIHVAVHHQLACSWSLPLHVKQLRSLTIHLHLPCRQMQFSCMKEKQNIQ